MDAVYATLRELAFRRLGPSGARELQIDPTDLVHEAWVKLSAAGALDGSTRVEFLPLAAKVLRQVLVDLVRREQARKRGGDLCRVTLSSKLRDPGQNEIDLLALDEALERLEALHERQARIVELRYFAGLSVDETAAALGVSARTVDGDWRMARAWLKQALER
jgi:RNA polymerase sigma factor (TIGR02999 family)